MGTVLGLLGLVVFVVCVVAVAAGVTWLVVELFPSGSRKKPKPEAQAIAARAGINDVITREKLFDPEVNVAVGAAELAQKLQGVKGDPILAIAAYNAGTDAVGRWLAQTPSDDVDLFVESIPYAETRLYVKTVTRNRFEYRRIYEGSSSRSNPSHNSDTGNDNQRGHAASPVARRETRR